MEGLAQVSVKDTSKQEGRLVNPYTISDQLTDPEADSDSSCCDEESLGSESDLEDQPETAIEEARPIVDQEQAPQEVEKITFTYSKDSPAAQFVQAFEKLSEQYKNYQDSLKSVHSSLSSGFKAYVSGEITDPIEFELLYRFDQKHARLLFALCEKYLSELKQDGVQDPWSLQTEETSDSSEDDSEDETDASSSETSDSDGGLRHSKKQKRNWSSGFLQARYSSKRQCFGSGH